MTILNKILVKHLEQKNAKKDFFCDCQAHVFLYHLPLTHSHTMTPFDAPGKQAF